MTIIYSSINNENVSKIQSEELFHTWFNSKSPSPVWPYNKAMVIWELLFCSGQIWLNPETMELVSGWIEEETKQACRNLSNLLREFGSSAKEVVKITIFLKNIYDLEIVNNVYKNYFILKPARSVVWVSALPKGASIEIEAIAKKSKNTQY